MNNDKLFELIDSTDVGSYGIYYRDAVAIAKRNSFGTLECIEDAFKYGFVKGQRAEKAKQARKRRGTV